MNSHIPFTSALRKSFSWNVRLSDGVQVVPQRCREISKNLSLFCSGCLACASHCSSLTLLSENTCNLLVFLFERRLICCNNCNKWYNIYQCGGIHSLRMSARPFLARANGGSLSRDGDAKPGGQKNGIAVFQNYADISGMIRLLCCTPLGGVFQLIFEVNKPYRNTLLNLFFAHMIINGRSSVR